RAHEDIISGLEAEAKTVLLVAAGEQVIGIIAVADRLKTGVKEAMEEFRSMGIETVMVTGDNERTARAIAKRAGIKSVIAGVTPDGKVDALRKLQESYRVVAMVGDGMNDAPALKQANVGIALGSGTDIAIEAADITLVSDAIDVVIRAIKLSQATFKKIKENYFWAWIYNAIAIPFAMFGLLHPMIGAAMMSLSSLNVIYNSLRLKRIDLGRKAT
ncbi:MAG: HAD-IC family P-type ATPase, partial [Acholeplasmataceae bacterium]